MMAKITNESALSLLQKFETEREQFRNLWDQLTPSFQHMGTVIAKFNEISLAMPALESQHAQLVASIAGFKSEEAEGKRKIKEHLDKYQEQMEKELAPLIKELVDTREKVLAMQGARADAERAFEARRIAQENTIRELTDREAEARQKLSEIGRLAGTVA
jgi:Skp family chaperone for outer membrane proteins